MQVPGGFEDIGKLAPPRGPVAEAIDDGATHPIRQRAPEGKVLGEPGHVAERGIPAKEFVAAKARKGDRHPAPLGGLTDIVGVDAVARRLVEGVQDPRQIGGDLLAGENDFVVLGPEVLGRETGGLAFGVFRFVKDNGEGFQPGWSLLCHQANDRRRIQTTRQEGPHWNIRKAVGSDCILQLAAQLRDKVPVAAGRLLRDRLRHAPPRAVAHATAGSDGDQMPGRQVGDKAVDRARRRDCKPREIVADGHRIDFRRKQAAKKERIQLGGKDEASAR